MGRLILVTGGARSGKSRFAQERAAMLQATAGGTVAFLATGQRVDEEMDARIDRHQRDRPADWETVEAPLGAEQRIAELVQNHTVVLLDCLTLLVSNVLWEAREAAPDVIEERVRKAAASLCAGARAGDATVIVVTNEVGMGLHPDHPIGRLFRDVAGRANQIVAAEAEEVVFMVCGLPMRVK